ncbi:winged helix-turn-helix transcriptional regulator [Clostridium chromiireducens]
MTKELRTLEKYQLIECKVCLEVPSKVEYSLTNIKMWRKLCRRK